MAICAANFFAGEKQKISSKNPSKNVAPKAMSKGPLTPLQKTTQKNEKTSPRPPVFETPVVLSLRNVFKRPGLRLKA
jgi:hypothetical protein